MKLRRLAVAERFDRVVLKMLERDYGSAPSELEVTGWQMDPGGRLRITIEAHVPARATWRRKLR